VQVESLFPIAVLRQFALVENNPEPKLSVFDLEMMKVHVLVPCLFIQALWIGMGPRSTQSPEQALFPVLCPFRGILNTVIFLF